MKKFAIMYINVGEGSNFEPSLIGIRDSRKDAMKVATEYLKNECLLIKDQTDTDVKIDSTGLHASDDFGMISLHMTIQEIDSYDIILNHNEEGI